MKPIETIKLESETLTINGIEIPVTVHAEIYNDDDADLSFLEGDELKRMEQRLSRGDVNVVGIVIVARAEGIEGSDSLWGCFIESREQLFETIQDQQMISLSLENLESEIESAAKRLAKFAAV